MSLRILDTDHVSLLLRGDRSVAHRFAQVEPKEIATTVITADEILGGWLSLINKTNSPSQSSKLVLAYTELLRTLGYLSNIRLLNFDNVAYSLYESLRSENCRIGTKDLRIAAIALSVNGVVVTRNQRDFSQIPNLRIEDWTINISK